MSTIGDKTDGGNDRRRATMQAQVTPASLPATRHPRLLTRQQAAAYCGVSVGTFNYVCPVRPIALGAGARMERFDIAAIDMWISNFHVKNEKNEVDWLSLLKKKP